MNLDSLCRNIRLLVLDVDGVLTDGGLYYDHEGRISKRFNVQDGLGIKVAQKCGLEIAVITGLDNPSVRKRVEELGITEYHCGHLHKVPVLQGICDRLEIDVAQACYVGDDWIDVGPMKVVGLPIAVANAQPEVFPVARYTTTAKGGDGAVREVIRLILEAQGSYASALEAWDQ